MIRRNIKGFTLVELLIVIGIILVLMGLYVAVAPTIFERLDDTTCTRNLRELYNALLLYKGKFSRFPDRGGDLFLAKLYFTEQMPDYKVYICPTDKAKDGAVFTDATAKKCLAPEKDANGNLRYYNLPDGKRTIYNFAEEERWSDEGAQNDTFGRTEFSYAGRWNLRDGEQEPVGWQAWYNVLTEGGEPTAIVSDDCENATGPVDTMIHKDHLNVLYTSGQTKAESAIVGVKGQILEALKN